MGDNDRIKHNSLHELQGEIGADFPYRHQMHLFKSLNYGLCALGHIGERSLQVWSKRNMLNGYMAGELNVCKCCNFGEQENMHFCLITKETTDIMRLIRLHFRGLFAIFFKQE